MMMMIIIIIIIIIINEKTDHIISLSNTGKEQYIKIHDTGCAKNSLPQARKQR